MELGEALVECARRELEEETGIEVGEGAVGGGGGGRLVATENCVFRVDGSSDAGRAWPPEGAAAEEGPPGAGGGGGVRAHYVTLFVRFDEPSAGAWPAPEDREPGKHSPFEFASWEDLVAASSSSSSSRYAPLFGPLRMLVEKHGSLDQLR